ncbi:hypothetical protein V6N12_073389 [Hibiscus sabdariffa]|uniref:Uncharacterized protein n=1 Tax=Hibiscus sabdariffa TaxID=183260 RepID=A0ABR2BT51_9ROSI
MEKEPFNAIEIPANGPLLQRKLGKREEKSEARKRVVFLQLEVKEISPYDDSSNFLAGEKAIRKQANELMMTSL